MPLSAGQRLGPFEILAPLGAGRMARSTRRATRDLVAQSLLDLAVQKSG